MINKSHQITSSHIYPNQTHHKGLILRSSPTNLIKTIPPPRILPLIIIYILDPRIAQTFVHNLKNISVQSFRFTKHFTHLVLHIKAHHSIQSIHLIYASRSKHILYPHSTTPFTHIPTTTKLHPISTTSSWETTTINSSPPSSQFCHHPSIYFLYPSK